jgi:hypothetical protein
MKRRKIYYVPGMISLIFLPILCVWYLEKNKNVERCIEILYPYKYTGPHNEYSLCSHRFDTTCLSEDCNRRIYSEIKLSGNRHADSIDINKFEHNVLDIISKDDTINGILLTFHNNSDYSFLITAIDICRKDSLLPVYVLYENHLWFWHSQYVVKNKSNFQKEYNDRINRRRANSLKNPEKVNKSALKGAPEKIITDISLLTLYILLSIISIYYTFKNYIKTNHK